MEEQRGDVGPQTKLVDHGLFVVVGGLLRLLVTVRKRRKVLHAMEDGLFFIVERG